MGYQLTRDRAQNANVGRLDNVRPAIEGKKPSSIIFIHGLSGSAKSTWAAMTRLFANDPRFVEHEIDYYQYPTRLIRLPLTPPLPKLSDLAHGLRTLIEEKHASSSISIVAHSLGGLIARKYIVDVLKSGHELTVKNLALIAVPNTGASLANVANHLTFPHYQLKALAKDSDSLNKLNIDWLNYSAEKSLSVKYILGGADRIVAHNSGSPYNGVGSASLLIEADHRSIVSPVDERDIRYLAVSSFIMPTIQSRAAPVIGAERHNPLAGDPLFDIYTTTHEPFYYPRSFDAVLGDVVVGSHVWVTGRSGCGKSAALRRVVALSGWKLLHINLATHEMTNAENMTEALTEELLSINDGGPALESAMETANRLRRLKLAIEAQGSDEVVGIVIEEIPLPPIELGRFLQHIATVIELLGSESDRPQQVRLLFSSIHAIDDPSNAISAKTREMVQLIPVSPWTITQMLALGTLIRAASDHTITDHVLEKIVTAADGSPRFMKAVFRKFRNGMATPANIDDVCQGVRLESL